MGSPASVRIEVGEKIGPSSPGGSAVSLHAACESRAQPRFRKPSLLRLVLCLELQGLAPCADPHSTLAQAEAILAHSAPLAAPGLRCSLGGSVRRGLAWILQAHKSWQPQLPLGASACLGMQLRLPVARLQAPAAGPSDLLCATPRHGHFESAVWQPAAGTGSTHQGWQALRSPRCQLQNPPRFPASWLPAVGPDVPEAPS